MKDNWKGLQPPPLGSAVNPARGRVRPPVGRTPKAQGDPIGKFKIGRKSRSRKIREVFG